MMFCVFLVKLKPHSMDQVWNIFSTILKFRKNLWFIRSPFRDLFVYQHYHFPLLLVLEGFLWTVVVLGLRAGWVRRGLTTSVNEVYWISLVVGKSDKLTHYVTLVGMRARFSRGLHPCGFTHSGLAFTKTALGGPKEEGHGEIRGFDWQRLKGS